MSLILGTIFVVALMTAAFFYIRYQKSPDNPKNQKWESGGYNTGENLKLTQRGFEFIFPDNKGSVNAIKIGRHGMSLSPARTIRIHYRVTRLGGDPVFKNSGDDGTRSNF